MADADKYWGKFADEKLKITKHIVPDNIMNSILIPHSEYKNFIFFSQGIGFDKQIVFEHISECSHREAFNLLKSSCISILTSQFENIELDSAAVVFSLAKDFIRNVAIDINQPYIADLVPDIKRKKVENIIANKCKLSSVDELINIFVNSKWKVFGKKLSSIDMEMEEISHLVDDILPLSNKTSSDLLTLTDETMDLLPDSAHVTGGEFNDNDSCFDSGPPSKIAKLNIF